MSGAALVKRLGKPSLIRINEAKYSPKNGKFDNIDSADKNRQINITPAISSSVRS
jgi:hypothetical protein